MKKPLVFIAFIFVFSSASFSQVLLTKVCGYPTFPIGAIAHLTADTLQPMFGMNFTWYAWGYTGTPFSWPQQAEIQIDTAVHVRDPFYKNPDTTIITGDQNSIFWTAAFGKDIRVFMPGTSGSTSDYIYGWGNKSGFPASGSPEWEIDGDTAALGYVLRFSPNDVNYPPNLAISDPYSGNNPNHTGTFSYDFVFFFDTTTPYRATEWTSTGNTAALYSVEYWVKKSSDAAFSFYLADTITKTSYRSDSIANTQIGMRSVGAENLSHWSTLMPINHNYKIQKHILRIDTMYQPDGSGNLTLAPLVDVRVRNFQKIPIFVRLLRIRDWVGQRLLSGAADVQLDSAINLLKNHEINNSLKSWTVASEMNYRNFHAWSYLNDLVVHQQAPPLNILAPIDYDLFQRVMHDQTQYDQPYVMSP